MTVEGRYTPFIFIIQHMENRGNDQYFVIGNRPL